MFKSTCDISALGLIEQKFTNINSTEIFLSIQSLFHNLQLEIPIEIGWAPTSRLRPFRPALRSAFATSHLYAKSDGIFALNYSIKILSKRTACDKFHIQD